MAKTKSLLLVLISLLVIVILYLLLWPVPIDPVAWTPPAAPSLTGPYQSNNLLAKTERLSLANDGANPGAGFAPEDVALDAEGRIYAGLDDGRIMKLQADGTRPEVFVNTQGRPLGLVFNRDGNLIVADAYKGLLSIGPDRSVTVLTTAADDLPLVCTNDLDVAADGTIYFTDASFKFPISSFTADLLEHRGNGRFLLYDPKTKTTRTLLRDLSFANGVAVSPDQSFALVAETGKYLIHRVWLNGPRQGQAEVFIDNLPGFPDGISSNGKDKFWLALVTPRKALLDKVLPHPFARKVIARLPKFLQPKPEHYSFVLGLDLNGRVVDNLQDGSRECYAEIANAVERDGTLYFGSIGERAVGRYRLQSASQSAR